MRKFIPDRLPQSVLPKPIIKGPPRRSLPSSQRPCRASLRQAIAIRQETAPASVRAARGCRERAPEHQLGDSLVPAATEASTTGRCSPTRSFNWGTTSIMSRPPGSKAVAVTASEWLCMHHSLASCPYGPLGGNLHLFVRARLRLSNALGRRTEFQCKVFQPLWRRTGFSVCQKPCNLKISSAIPTP